MSFSQDPRRRGVAHADDIMYLNGMFLDQPQKYPTESAVAEIIQQYWVNFAKTGNPNGKGLPYWPTFDESKPTTMQFSNGMDSTLVFDVTDQVQTRYKGGVITVELDMDTVPIPRRKGGSGFDAVVVDYEDGGTHEFEM